MTYELSPALQAQIELAVEQGQITPKQASQLVRETVLEGTAAATAAAKAAAPSAKPWQNLIKFTPPTDRQIVAAALKREGLSELQIAHGLIDALETGYKDHQEVIANTKASMQAQAAAAAEQEWLRTTDDGKTEFERRTLAEASSILQAESAAKTKADAARVILEKRDGISGTEKLSDIAATTAVFGASEGSEQ